jgi:hypothetical protein
VPEIFPTVLEPLVDVARGSFFGPVESPPVLSMIHDLRLLAVRDIISGDGDGDNHLNGVNLIEC